MLATGLATFATTEPEAGATSVGVGTDEHLVHLGALARSNPDLKKLVNAASGWLITVSENPFRIRQGIARLQNQGTAQLLLIRAVNTELHGVVGDPCNYT